MPLTINPFFRISYWLFLFLIAVSTSQAKKPNARSPLDSNVVFDSILVLDKNGKCGLMVRRVNRGDFGTSFYHSEIKAALYSNQKANSQPIWKLRDFNSNALETVEYSRNQYQLMDVDSNGQTDVFLWYSKVSDGLDPDTLKLFLYVNGVKYGIRGRIPKLESDLNLYESKPDANNSQASPEIRRLMEKQWAEIVNPKLEALKAETIE